MPKETQLNQYVIPIHGIIGEPYHGNDKRQYFSFRDLLIHLNNSKSYDSIKLDISSDGGSVDEGKKMESAILAIGKPIFSENSGNVASAASRIFCLATFENRSFNPDKGVFLIHNPWLEMAGDSKELANASEYLAEIEEDYISFYENATTADRSVLAAFMNENVPLTENEIESLGFSKIQKNEFNPVAFFNLNNKSKSKMENEVKEKLSLIESMTLKILALFQPKALMLTDIDGNELQMDEIKDVTEIKPGIKVLIGGEAKTGDFKMPDGSIIVVENGIVKEVKNPTNEVEALQAEIETLKAELQTVQAQKIELEKTNSEFKAQASAIATEFNTFKSKVSAQFNPSPAVPDTGKTEPTKKFTYKRK